MQTPIKYSSIFKKFQGTQKIINTASDTTEMLKLSNEGIRLILNEEEFHTFLIFLLDNNKDYNHKTYDNYLNSNTKIDFDKHALIVSYEAIIKNVYNSDSGYYIEFQDEVRGYSDYFYPVIVIKNFKSEEILYLNKKLGPYLDTNYYPKYLNNIVDLFHNLNSQNVSLSPPIFSDLKKEISSMISPCLSSNETTQCSFKGEVKYGKVVIVGLDDDDDENETISTVDKKHKNNKDNKEKKNENKKETKKKEKKKHAKKKTKKCK